MKQESTDKRIRTWVSEDGKHAVASMSLGSGGGIGHKLGKGGKGEQNFRLDNGEYAGEGGGSSTGPVYRGTVRLPNEVRREVTPPVQKGKVATPPPAPLSKGGRVGTTAKNDESGKKNPDPEALHAKTREQVQNVLDKDSGTHDVNMNSGYRSGDTTAHGEGRAVDINRINDQKVSDAIDPNVPAEQRETMRERLKEIRTAADANKEVEAYIDPVDGYFRPADPNSKSPGRKAKDQEIHDHRHHIHITIRK